jgi:hypothetical protein
LNTPEHGVATAPSHRPYYDVKLVQTERSILRELCTQAGEIAASDGFKVSGRGTLKDFKASATVAGPKSRRNAEIRLTRQGGRMILSRFEGASQAPLVRISEAAFLNTEPTATPGAGLLCSVIERMERTLGIVGDRAHGRAAWKAHLEIMAVLSALLDETGFEWDHMAFAVPDPARRCYLVSSEAGADRRIWSIDGPGFNTGGMSPELIALIRSKLIPNVVVSATGSSTQATTPRIHCVMGEIHHHVIDRLDPLDVMRLLASIPQECRLLPSVADEARRTRN